MNGIFSRINVYFLHANFSTLRLDEYLQLLATNTPTLTNEHSPRRADGMAVWSLLIRTLLTCISSRGMYFSKEMRRYGREYI
jgi:hypothetical protein